MDLFNLSAVFEDVNNFVAWLWGMLSAPVAIIIYIVIIVAIIVLLIVSIMTKEKRYTKAMNRLRKGKRKAGGAEKTENAKEEDAGVSRFCMLKELDEKYYGNPQVKQFDDVDLRVFCEEFRNFAAHKLGLYYDISDIRRFIAGLAVSRVVILQGMSGTGKTSLAYAFGEFLENPSAIIPVQPMWKERTDLLGYYNEFTKRFNETLLLQKLYEANYNEEIYITILDEMNIARVEYYFAEFLSLLEIPDPDARMLEVVTDVWKTDPKLLKEGRLKLPGNMWFIGTANNDDSTFAISDKVYDRAMVLNLDKKSEPFHVAYSRNVHLSAAGFTALAAAAQRSYTITAETMEKLASLDEYLIKTFRVTFGNRIMKQIKTYLPVYVSCGGEELEALDDIVAKKVLRKLETQNAVYVRAKSEEVCAFFDDLFGPDRMTACKEYLRRLANNA